MKEEVIPDSKKAYKVTFIFHGGIKDATIKVEENKKVKEPAKPSRTGYAFEGWYLGKKKFDFNTKIKKDIKLEAKWEKIVEKEVPKETPNETPKEPVKPVDVSSIKLNASEITLEKGKTFQIKTTFTPSNATDKTLTYRSNNNTVMTVDERGVVTAVSDKTRSAQIVVTSHNGKKAYLTVVATNPVKSVSLSVLDWKQEAITVYGGGQKEISYKASLSAGEYDKLSWTATGTNGYRLVDCADNSLTCTVRAYEEGTNYLKTVTLNVNVTRKDGKVLTSSRKIDIEGPFTLAHGNNYAPANPTHIVVGNTIRIDPQLFRIAEGRPLISHTKVNIQVVDKNRFDIKCLEYHNDVIGLTFSSAAGQNASMNIKCVN